ncbi:hypothetical protein mRhiFer1_009696 [Rhinolophus ferrumequinum]|uniref:Uncharacterized protein n=1 Tax=Rhinolophus ferrumequinum TaxID=59479 RepID=A0A7J7R0T6_RHIFE|nr:hypothetical protein mRhiFer1_009696 [Rhinolophus ferrumequinum]
MTRGAQCGCHQRPDTSDYGVHCLADFCGEHVNHSNPTAEAAGLVATRNIRDLPLYTSHTAPCVSDLPRMRAVVGRVGGSVANSHLHGRCTSTVFSNFKCHFKMVLRSLNNNRASAIFCDCPACHMVTLAFI